MAMPHDLNKNDSYDNLMGKEQRSHLGSQSKGHGTGGSAGYKAMSAIKGGSSGAKTNDPGGSTPGKVGSGGRKDLGM